MKNKEKYSSFRIAWLCLGFLCLGLGGIGVLLPLMPTTEFLLIAAYAFARSSDRLHDWLLSHSLFGPLIHNWQKHGAISKRGKIFSSLSMIVVIGISLILKAPNWLVYTQVFVLGCVAAFLLTRPLPPHEKI